ncbi:MAG: hypothetical protein F6K14_19095 [Symploca sp. SIO2C1]|nr:hypothetical protein [Symploca sp. SIO2C1]
MKASEVLKRYNNGRKDFSGECLRGESLQGMNLADADFSEADIRGTNFTNAYLRGAKFCGAKAGLQKRWAIFLVVVLWLLSAMSGIFSLWIGLLVELIFDASHIKRITGLFSIIELAIFFIVTIRKNLVAGLTAGLGAGVVVVMVTGVVTLAGAVTVTFAGTGAAALVSILSGVGATAAAGVTSVVGAFTIAGAVAVVGAFSAALVLIFIGAGVFSETVTLAGVITFAEPGAFVFAVAVAVTLLSVYLGYRVLCGDKSNAWIGAVAIAFAATGGTSFRGADLTDADFTAARLKSTDFRKAILTRTCWRNVKKLHYARPGTSYLQNTKVQELVITGDGQNKEYDHLPNLRGINLQVSNLVGADFTGSVLKDGTLQGANLTDATLTVANLNETNLRDANLSRAKLKQVQLHCADLTGATLTGAYIKHWGITTTTKLNGVKCDYVFMRLPTNEDPNPHRKPDNWNKNFAEGEFVDFITPMVLTLDLYHNQVKDPRLIAYAWQKLVEENPEAELELVSMEKRGKGKDKLLLRAETSPKANHSQLSAEYFETYDYLGTLPPEAISRLIADKDHQIGRLEGMVSMAISRPGIYAENYKHQGDTMPDKSSEINISGVTGSKISGVAGGESTAVAGENLTGVAGGDISGTVTNTINQLSESESPEAPTLADLLKQLQTAIASQDSGLSQKEQKKALKHLDTIGKLGVDRNNSNLQEMAENALDALPTILKRGAGLMEFLKTHFNLELDEILDNIQEILNF